jgi:hypothetical protein
VDRVINISLDEASIDRAIAELANYRKYVNDKVNELCRRLVDTGVEIAKAKIVQMGAIFSGELSDSITGWFEPSTGVGYIEAGSPYAFYVEFGTGIVGQSSPHPLGGTYDVNGHGEDGWWWFDDEFGRWRWTQGMEARPFMYETARQLLAEAVAL